MPNVMNDYMFIPVFWHTPTFVLPLFIEVAAVRAIYTVLGYCSETLVVIIYTYLHVLQVYF